jgi:hypothetical protein
MRDIIGFQDTVTYARVTLRYKIEQMFLIGGVATF